MIARVRFYGSAGAQRVRGSFLSECKNPSATRRNLAGSVALICGFSHPLAVALSRAPADDIATPACSGSAGRARVRSGRCRRRPAIWPPWKALSIAVFFGNDRQARQEPQSIHPGARPVGIGGRRAKRRASTQAPARQQPSCKAWTP